MNRIVRSLKIFYHHWMVVGFEKNIERIAIKHLHSLTELGDDWGMLELGARLENGASIEKNYKKAFECYSFVASRLSPCTKFAEFNIGNMYMNGLYHPKCEATASQWFFKSAQRGFAPAQYNYGLSLIDGWAGSNNETEGITWLQRASNNGLNDASMALKNILKGKSNEALRNET
ncbi:tetratricopeptide repeat protein [Aquipseudomonas guryensis]|uniref:Sel1 repeat family protein n=1 Tax=Aquipseudomonas guryensis TaxID=2759165 RepID=A0A7W4DCB2_9GAMM|nr:tetratricopeptide repeat protein [Pseudomonas guryensis]MBB1519905.1 sel1 repeat family protein [Pseudomonas guryensis]